MKDLELEQEKELKAQLDAKLKIGEGKNFLFGANDDVKNPFGGGDNPFSSDDNPFGGNPFDKKVETSQSKLDFASAAAKAAPKLKQKKSALGELPEYQGYFIYVDQETFKKKQAKKLPDNLKMSKDALDLETEGSTSKELNPETQAVASGLQDEVFQRFSDIVEYNPLQVLRYDLGGSPLLFTSKDDVATKITKKLVPNPGYNPSSFRQFELQVMPKTIIDFEKNNIDINGGIEWGTIIVYTDKEDFVPILDQNHVGYVEEWVGVQWEEPIQKK
jgi:pre-rRNA-processing protein TSR4